MKLLCVSLLLAIFANQIDVAPGTPGCYSFNDDTDGWDLSSDLLHHWEWSGYKKPDFTGIPTFDEKDGAYMWFQDQSDPPQQAVMTSSPSVALTLNIHDNVTASIWRHLFVGTSNDTGRPVLRFVTGTSVQNVLSATDYDTWETITVMCETTAGGDASTRTALCCDGGFYPCSGYFRVEGQVNYVDELLIFDQLEVNNECSITPAVNCDCDFDTADLCNWSPATISTDWKWSAYYPTSVIPPPPTYSEFIYIIDTSAEINSEEIFGVDNTLTTFVLSYYLKQSNNQPNRLEVFFRTTTGYTVYFTPYPPALSAWSTVTYSCATFGCCGGTTTCDGTFYIETVDFVGEMQHVAIDNFDVSGAGTCNGVVPTPPPVNCWCNFDSSYLCGWSPSAEWIWSSTYPTTQIPPPPTGTPFIYVIDASAPAYSAPISGVHTGMTTFTINYYFNANMTVLPNNLEVYFITTTGAKTYFSSGLPLATFWTPVTFTCGEFNCCGYGVENCDGTFYVETVFSPGTYLQSGIDDFQVSGAGIC